MIRIGIVDDKSICRNMIKQNLSGIDDIEICIEATNGEDFLNQIEKIQPNNYPHLVLMDIDMPIINGIQTIALAAAKYKTIKFLVLTVFDDDDKIFEAIKSGASGYLLKDDAPHLLVDSIKNAHNLNGAPMSPAIARKTLQWLKEGRPSQVNKKKNIDSIVSVLTDREQELLLLLVEGHDYKRIAEILFISPQTVRTHISRIYEKLHINSKAEAILLAHKYNLF
jgi:DNA-binding NarL/FixJ family response regulator